MSDLLLILNPRRIEECLGAFKALRTPKAWVTGYTEKQLTKVIPSLIRQTEYENYIVCSDDVIVSQDALNAVRRALRSHPVATGFCNLSASNWNVNLTKSPLTLARPNIRAYDFKTYAEVVSGPSIQRTWFAGMCLTGMPKDLWLKFPFRSFTAQNPNGYGSDYSLSKRLQDKGIPIVAPRQGFCLHLKERWNLTDQEPRKHLRIGEDRGVTFA